MTTTKTAIRDLTVYGFSKQVRCRSTRLGRREGLGRKTVGDQEIGKSETAGNDHSDDDARRDQPILENQFLVGCSQFAV